MKASDLDRFFTALNQNGRASKTCDGFKAGNPDTELTGIVVTWMANLEVIRAAIRRDINCIITHEPIYYNHWDSLTALENDEAVQAKLQLIRQYNLVIYRVHDLWDTFPVYGILDSWAALLDWSTVITGDLRHKVYSISPATLKEIAMQVKHKMNLPGIRVCGDLGQPVSKVALGVGAWGQLDNVKAVRRLGADCLVTGETCEWQAVRYAEDINLGMIVTGHIHSENPGVLKLALFLQERLGSLRVVFVDSGDLYQYL